MSDMILCPTRGGKASYLNQDRAIALAKERGVDLLFLYVTNVEFLEHTARAKVVDLEAELDEMGEFLLAMAQERAQKAGVKAFATVRRGVFRRVLKDVLEEYPITTIVMGSSEKSGRLVIPEYVQKMGKEFSRETGVEFIVLHDGEITHTFQSE
jgi:nucleotide-binding universal stress UspA family protein